jgi:hypothetical protein
VILRSELRLGRVLAREQTISRRRQQTDRRSVSVETG